MNAQEIFLLLVVVTSIIVGLPCLLVRPLFMAIADRISGKQGGSREIKELKTRVDSLEREVRTLRTQVISLESSQEFSNKLIETMKSKP